MQRRKALQLLAAAPIVAAAPMATRPAAGLEGVATDAVASPSFDRAVSVHDFVDPAGREVGTSVEVNDAAFAWLASAHPRQPWLLHPKAEYRISKPVPMAGIATQQLHGNGASIVQTDPRQPVIAVGDHAGSSQVLKDVVVKHVDKHPESAVGVAFRGNTSQSLFDNVVCWNVAKGFATAPGSNAHWQIFFSNHMRGCRVQNFTHTGIELLAVNGGQTQNVFENTYMNNALAGSAQPQTCHRPLNVRTMFGQIWNGLNIEHMRMQQPVIFHQSQATVNALHMEGVISDAQSLIQVYNEHSTLLINGDFLDCEVAKSGGSLFALGPHTKVHWNGGSLRQQRGLPVFVAGPIQGAAHAEFRRSNTSIVDPANLAGDDHPQFPLGSYKANESLWFALEDRLAGSTYRVTMQDGAMVPTLVSSTGTS